MCASVCGLCISVFATAMLLGSPSKKPGTRSYIPAHCDSFIHTASIPQNASTIGQSCKIKSEEVPPGVWMLKDILPPDASPEPDEFGRPSNFTSLFHLCHSLIGMGILSPAPTAVNVGARDGIGKDGNTDPTWPLFSRMGFSGVAIEGSVMFAEELARNMQGLDVRTVINMATPENIVSLIEGPQHGAMHRVDVLKVDIDGWDCQVIPAILRRRSLGIKVVMVEFNVKFPPPIKMALATCPPAEYHSCARYHLYGCSLQYMQDNVMAPAGYVLVQVDWQNAIYVSRDVALQLRVPSDETMGVAAAYEHGYARRPMRAQNFPWNHDIDHLIESRGMPVSRVWQMVHEYVTEGYHLQSGAVTVGCGETMTTLEYVKSPSIRQGDRIGDC